MVSREELTQARDACLACLTVARETHYDLATPWGSLLSAWVRSGLHKVQWRYLVAAMPDKYGYIIEGRPPRPDEVVPMPLVFWLTPDDTNLSNDEVRAIWDRMEPEFIEPLDKFASAVIEIFEDVGRIFKVARERLTFEVNDAILLATHSRKKPVDIPGVVFNTYHKAALKMALQALSVSSGWNRIDEVWREADYLRERLEVSWRSQYKGTDRYLHRFLSYQNWMLDIENPERRNKDKLSGFPAFGFPEYDTEAVEREIMHEWAAAMEKAGPRVAETSGGNGNTTPSGGAKVKKSTVKGEARTKIVAALTMYHKYEDELSDMFLGEIGSNELARLARVSNSTVSKFFKDEFDDGRFEYKRACGNQDQLANILRRLNDESPSARTHSYDPALENGYTDDPIDNIDD